MMFKAIFKTVENRYTYIKYFCFSSAIKTHCRKLVVKKNGNDKSRILKGIIETAKSDLISENKGEINQKGIMVITDKKRNIKK